MPTIHLNFAGFKRRIANPETMKQDWTFLGSRPAVIDFYASWCGPCKALSPIIDEVAKQYEGRVDIYKVNVDEEPELADAFNIRSIPTLYFIPMSGKPRMTIGGMTKAELVKNIQNL
jgi:thioredoxin